MIKLFLFTLMSATLWANVYDLSPIKVTSSVTCFIGDYNPPMKKNKGFVSNVCYVDMGNSVVVIEPGPTYVFAQELNELIESDLGKKVTHVIATNFHDDRYTGASYYKEKNIPIVGHTTIVEEIKQYPEKFTRISKVTSKEEYAKSKVVMPDILTQDKYLIKGSKQTLEVLKLSSGSNSKSDIAVYSPQDDFIFMGNIVFNGRMIKYGKYSSMDPWIEALEKLQKMNVKYILGGHGEQYDKNSYKRNLAYLKSLRTQVKKMYEEDMDILDIKKAVDTAEFNDVDHYETIAPANISRYYNHLEWEE
ncbi:MAG: MBL fold metallo-hydrolase [Campylobacterota bacterium]|nr:MBL fold metallo-hydrolase [Campylobacterota bacterium]